MVISSTFDGVSNLDEVTALPQADVSPWKTKPRVVTEGKHRDARGAAACRHIGH